MRRSFRSSLAPTSACYPHLDRRVLSRHVATPVASLRRAVPPFVIALLVTGGTRLNSRLWGCTKLTWSEKTLTVMTFCRVGPLAQLTLCFNELRQPEIQNLRVTVTRDHDVVRLQIAMHDAGRMGFRQSFGDDVFAGSAISCSSTFALSVNLLTQGLPSTTSIAIKRVPSCPPISKICAMLGWLSAAADLASRMNRAIRSRFDAMSTGRIFNATL